MNFWKIPTSRLFYDELSSKLRKLRRLQTSKWPRWISAETKFQYPLFAAIRHRRQTPNISHLRSAGLLLSNELAQLNVRSFTSNSAITPKMFVSTRLRSSIHSHCFSPGVAMYKKNARPLWTAVLLKSPLALPSPYPRHEILHSCSSHHSFYCSRSPDILWHRLRSIEQLSRHRWVLWRLQWVGNKGVQNLRISADFPIHRRCSSCRWVQLPKLWFALVPTDSFIVKLIDSLRRKEAAGTSRTRTPRSPSWLLTLPMMDSISLWRLWTSWRMLIFKGSNVSCSLNWLCIARARARI